jgi:hypothetical protein
MHTYWYKYGIVRYYCAVFAVDNIELYRVGAFSRLETSLILELTAVSAMARSRSVFVRLPWPRGKVGKSRQIETLNVLEEIS